VGAVIEVRRVSTAPISRLPVAGNTAATEPKFKSTVPVSADLGGDDWGDYLDDRATNAEDPNTIIEDLLVQWTTVR
jgi:hypothetical protein